jgi:hypothetical protein
MRQGLARQNRRIDRGQVSGELARQGDPRNRQSLETLAIRLKGEERKCNQAHDWRPQEAREPPANPWRKSVRAAIAAEVTATAFTAQPEAQ